MKTNSDLYFEQPDETRRDLWMEILCGSPEVAAEARRLLRKPKVKARDIIPGWPRGKSTTQPTVSPLTFWEEHEGRWFEMVSAFVPSDARYHALQQAMMDKWRLDGYRAEADNMLIACIAKMRVQGDLADTVLRLWLEAVYTHPRA